MDERDGERLLDGIEKQPPTGKSRDPFGIHGRGEPTDSRVDDVIHSAQFDLAVCSVTGRRQRGVRDTNRQHLQVVHAHPLF